MLVAVIGAAERRGAVVAVLGEADAAEEQRRGQEVGELHPVIVEVGAAGAREEKRARERIGAPLSLSQDGSFR